MCATCCNINKTPDRQTHFPTIKVQSSEVAEFGNTGVYIRIRKRFPNSATPGSQVPEFSNIPEFCTLPNWCSVVAVWAWPRFDRCMLIGWSLQRQENPADGSTIWNTEIYQKNSTKTFLEKKLKVTAPPKSVCFMFSIAGVPVKIYSPVGCIVSEP